MSSKKKKNAVKQPAAASAASARRSRDEPEDSPHVSDADKHGSNPVSRTPSPKRGGVHLDRKEMEAVDKQAGDDWVPQVTAAGMEAAVKQLYNTDELGSSRQSEKLRDGAKLLVHLQRAIKYGNDQKEALDLLADLEKAYRKVVGAYVTKCDQLAGAQAYADAITEATERLALSLNGCRCTKTGECTSCACQRAGMQCTAQCACKEKCSRPAGKDGGLLKSITKHAERQSEKQQLKLARKREEKRRARDDDDEDEEAAKGSYKKKKQSEKEKKALIKKLEAEKEAAKKKLKKLQRARKLESSSSDSSSASSSDSD